MRKIAEFIVNKYWIFFIVFALLLAYCGYGITRVKVEYDITKYLPDDTDTARALVVMEEEFDAFGSAIVFVKDVDKQTARELADKIRGVDGVIGFMFDADSPNNYKDGCALYSVYFDGDSKDPEAVAAYNSVIGIIKDSGKPFGVPTPLVNNYAKTLADEMVVIIAIAAAVILAVLLFTSKSFAEVLAFPIVFIVAAVLNLGTNYWLGHISFVSNTVCIILQLALAIDYAIILCHRFTEEKDARPGDAKAALTAALGKAIPEIASSSLTTVSGLVALMFMQLGLGFDLGMVLAKSIICSLLTVFLLMPGLLLLLSKLMDRSRHRNFVPKVTFLGKGAVKARYVIIGVFAVLFGVSAWLSQTVNYCYSQNSITTSRPTATMTAQAEAAEVFGQSNAFVILVPIEAELEVKREIASVVEREELITSSLGWETFSFKDGAGNIYYLIDTPVNYVELADATGLDVMATFTVFNMHKTRAGDTETPMLDYRATILEILEFALNDPDVGDLAGESLDSYGSLMEFAKKQFTGARHSRMVFNINASVEAKETFALIERLTPAVKNICADAIFAGSSMSAYDLNSSFRHDNLLISLLTVAFIYIILAFTFKSWAIPIALVLIIQGAIFVNFSIPALMGSNVFFFVYLIASAIQMGATIDYAILLTNRFYQFKAECDRKEAIVKATSAAFPTVITSGAIMTVAAFLVGFLTSDPLISSMGVILGTGTLISVLFVLTALPALLCVASPLLDKTVFGGKKKGAAESSVSAVGAQNAEQ